MQFSSLSLYNPIDNSVSPIDKSLVRRLADMGTEFIQLANTLLLPWCLWWGVSDRYFPRWLWCVWCVSQLLQTSECRAEGWREQCSGRQGVRWGCYLSLLSPLAGQLLLQSSVSSNTCSHGYIFICMLSSSSDSHIFTKISTWKLSNWLFYLPV